MATSASAYSRPDWDNIDQSPQPRSTVSGARISNIGTRSSGALDRFHLQASPWLSPGSSAPCARIAAISSAGAIS
jgi:hypothetical protein